MRGWLHVLGEPGLAAPGDEAAAVLGEVVLDPGLAEPELLERVLVRRTALARVGVDPTLHRALDLRRELAPDEGVDPPHLAQRIARDVAVPDVDEAVVPAPIAGGHAGVETVVELPRPALPGDDGVDVVGAEAPERDRHAREGGHALHRIAVGLDDAGVGEGGEELLEVAQVEGRLQHPEIAAAAGLALLPL